MLKRFLMIVLAMSIVLCFFAGCTASVATDPASESDTTDIIYQTMNTELVFATGIYSFNTPDINIDKYSQIRVVTFGNSGSGIINIQVVNITNAGESLGLLDSYQLDFGSSAGITSTRVYDIPGKRLKLSFTSMNHDYFSCIIYGR